MAYTQAGARAMATAHQMMLRASLENHPQHELHVQDTINYVNAVAEHYATMMKQYVDAKIDKLVSVEVNKQMNDTRVQLKMDEKSVQSAKKAIRGLFDGFGR